MSGKPEKPPKIDKRANRTRGALARAMIELGGTQGVDTIKTGDLARQAGVSRSTFYANFASKDDYLDRAFAGMFMNCERAQKTERPGDTGILPSWHLFHHIHAAKEFAVAIAKSDTFPQYLLTREALFRDRAAMNLKEARPDAPKDEIDALASMIAGAFAGLMRRWMETGLTMPPNDLHARFDAFVARNLRP